MFQSICSSKLYRTSPRKDKIEAAFNDPINSELVGQLAEALDEEYQTPDYLVKETNQSEKSSEGAPAEGTADSGDNASLDVNVHAPSGGSSSLSSRVSDEISEEESSTEVDTSTTDAPAANTSSSADAGGDAGAGVVEESTKVSGKPVVGSHVRNMFRDMRQVSDEIKGMLNFKDSTCGVNRILCKENELWIYYNDDVNLNNIMADVIELLNAANYTYLEFNRLARSDNAIVFLIGFAGSPSDVQSNPSGKKS